MGKSQVVDTQFDYSRLLKDVYLLDERAPARNTSIKVDKQAIQMRIDSTKHARKLVQNALSSDYTDKVKHLALEGTSLTLLGLVKYDMQHDSFKMTDLACCLSGGVQ